MLIVSYWIDALFTCSVGMCLPAEVTYGDFQSIMVEDFSDLPPLMRANSIKTFYRPEQAIKEEQPLNDSRSPEKAKLLLERISQEGIKDAFPIEGNFPPFARADYLLAHDPNYVDAFLRGKLPLCESNNLKWNSDLVEAVAYSNSSLYHAIKYSVLNPAQITLSPTSGFHHATPSRGGGFCTFSGQVIAALKIFQEYGMSGAFLDLDGHFGNSIEDSRAYCPELNLAIPKGCNINPQGSGCEYVAHFRNQLQDLKERVMNYDIGYVVFCHGADSHVDDDRGGQCSTAEWLECSKLFYEWLRDVDSLRGEPLSCSLALFGGYRKDNYDEVLRLHLSDLEQCLEIACQRRVMHPGA